MIYVDANIFIYAILDLGKRGENSRRLLKEITAGKNASTSSLTFDEVVWNVKKERGLDEAVNAGIGLLSLSNLDIINVDKKVIWVAVSLIKKHKIDPRDSIHAACCLLHNIKVIISNDPIFDKISELKRISI